jgi:hypothetical protein
VAEDNMTSGSLRPYHPKTGAALTKKVKFQHMPETFSDSIDIGWEPKQIPGQSQSLMQWASNGGRTFTFSLVLARQMSSSQAFLNTAVTSPFGFASNPSSKQLNACIREYIYFFRGCCYPIYDNQDSPAKVESGPPICVLDMPGMGLDEMGGDKVFVVVTGCDVEYGALFSSGEPRFATISLTMKQVRQGKVEGSDGVKYVDARSLFDSAKKRQDVGFSGSLPTALTSRSEGLMPFGD